MARHAHVSDQNEILGLVLTGDRSLIVQINDVKTRLSNDELRIDLDIRFKKDVTCEQELAYVETFQKRVETKYPGAQVQLVHPVKAEVAPQEEDKKETAS